MASSDKGTRSNRISGGTGEDAVVAVIEARTDRDKRALGLFQAHRWPILTSTGSMSMPCSKEALMQTENRLFDDLARVASGAINTLGGLREEIELRVKERLERLAAEMDLVSREEFDAVKAMAAKARAEQTALAARVAELEQALAGASTGAAAAPKKAAAPRKKQSTAKAGTGAPDAPATS
jgi:BMFP domain-containing protein YqiC